ncbi:uncharacterized protein ACBT57_002733 [Dama dama]
MEFKLWDRAREARDSQAGREVVNAGAERKLTASRDPSVGSRGDGRSEPSGEQEGNLLAATVWESRSARPGSSPPPPSPGSEASTSEAGREEAWRPWMALQRQTLSPVRAPLPQTWNLLLLVHPCSSDRGKCHLPGCWHAINSCKLI